MTAWPFPRPQEHATAAEHRTGSKVRCQRKRAAPRQPSRQNQSALRQAETASPSAARPQTPSERVKRGANYH